VELDCFDGTDNDRDGRRDCRDRECAFHDPRCLEVACSDLADDDGDGRVDCADPDCRCRESACADGLDDDDDGLVDCADGECAAACPEDCRDGTDDNGNDLVDCEDVWSCGATPGCCDDRCPLRDLGTTLGAPVATGITATRCSETGAEPGERGVAFRFTAERDGIYEFDLIGSRSLLTDFPARLSLYLAERCDELSAVTMIDRRIRAAPGFSSFLAGGTTVIAFIDDFDEYGTTEYALNIVRRGG
jgi:hypothetical protein